MAGKVLSAVFQTYKRLLQQYPIASQCVQCGVLMGSGDLIAQTVVERKKFHNINFQRTAEFACVGLFIVVRLLILCSLLYKRIINVFQGPSLTVWYRILDKRIGNKGTTVTIKKVALDQLLFAPVLNAVLLPTLALFRTGNVEKAKDALKRDYRDVLLANYKLWPLVQLCNFYFTPLQYQVLVVQMVALLWNTYLSWKTQRHP